MGPDVTSPADNRGYFVGRPEGQLRDLPWTYRWEVTRRRLPGRRLRRVSPRRVRGRGRPGRGPATAEGARRAGPSGEPSPGRGPRRAAVLPARRGVPADRGARPRSVAARPPPGRLVRR